MSVKVNLLLDNPGDCRSGHLNLDPFAPDIDDHSGRVKGDVFNLDAFVDDGEAEEIVALDILDYFPANEVDDILQNWLRKLARGGKLTIGVVDVREISRAILHNKLTYDEIGELLYGKQEFAWQYKRSGYTLFQLVAVFEGLGYRILSRRVHNYRAIVTVERV